ncbi:MAG: leucine-rich repeat protein [Erysipelotrichaceae bacterium]|uniref:leucine-rich repeat protein n=1 Tax=Anaerorhabdus sp. TaxID=1872524 RepID=UPI002FC98FF2
MKKITIILTCFMMLCSTYDYKSVLAEEVSETQETGGTFDKDETQLEVIDESFDETVEDNNEVITMEVVEDSSHLFMFDTNKQEITGFISLPDVSNKLIIPNEINGIPVLSIGNDAFSGIQFPTVEIPEGIINIGNSAFENNRALQSVRFPSTLKTLGTHAFDSCDHLEEVVLNEGLTNISDYAFGYASSLRTIVIPNSVNSIGSYAFYANSSLVSIVIGSGTKSIGSYAFASASNLSAIVIPDSVETIADNAFASTNKLTRIDIPSKVSNTITGAPWGNSKGIVFWKDVVDANPYVFNTTTQMIVGYNGMDTMINIPSSIPVNGVDVDVLGIGENAFASKTTLKSISLPDTILSIGSNAFNGCSELVSIDLGTSVISIGDMAFNFCPKLAEIQIPESIKTIGANAFLNTVALKKIRIPSKLTGTITGAPWGNSTGIIYWKEVVDLGDYVFNTANQQIIGYIGRDTVLTIPNSFVIDGQNIEVTSIGDNVFAGKAMLTSITIPNTIISIGKSSFSNCTELINISLGESLVDIGPNAFENCSKLVSITIPDSVNVIGTNAFSNTKNLKEININTKYSGTITGSPWGNLVGITYWKEVIHSGDFAYNTLTNEIVGYVGLGGDVEIPSTLGTGMPVTGIGYGAFAHNTTITSVTIPESVIIIDKYAFNNCSNLASITFSEGLTKINEQAFSYCKNITELNLPNSLIEIGNSAFRDNTSLVTVNFGDKIETINAYGFSSCTKLEEIKIPDSIKSIRYEAFANCTSVKEIEIGKSITAIDKTSFSNIKPDKVSILTQRTSAPITVSQSQPWGVVTGTPIYYLGEEVVFEHIIESVPNSYDRIIHIKASVAVRNKINYITLPNNIKINVNKSNWPDVDYYQFKVSANGDYTFSGFDDTLYKSDYVVTIDDIGIHSIIADDASASITELQNITIEDLLELINASAIDEIEENIDITITNEDLAKVRSINTHNQSVQITLTSIHPISKKIVSKIVTITGLNEYTVTYHHNDGTGQTSEEKVTHGESVKQIPNLTREGFKVNGWYLINNVNFNLENPVTSNIDLYANWVREQFKVTFIDWDGAILSELMLNYEDIIIAPQVKTNRINYKFTGWSPEVLEKVPAHDVNYYAIYVENKIEGRSEPDEINKTCQDLGYSDDFYWSETMKACITDIKYPSKKDVIISQSSEENKNENIVEVEKGTESNWPAVDILPDKSININEEVNQEKGWSLINLIASIIAILITLIASVYKKEKSEIGYEQEVIYMRNRKLGYWSIVTTITATTIMLLTQNFKDPMIWINNWTLIIIILVLISIILVYKSFKWSKK